MNEEKEFDIQYGYNNVDLGSEVKNQIEYTNDNIKLFKEYLIEKQEKILQWGDGEWVNEPDLVKFEYKGIECKIIRIHGYEGKDNEHLYGGHLCGYVCIPEDHKYYNVSYFDIEINAHGGLTFSDFVDGNKYWIGFDCALSHDYTPSSEHFKKTNKEMIEWKKKNPPPEGYENFGLFNPTYKNINFCIEECKSMVDQLLKEKEDDYL